MSVPEYLPFAPPNGVRYEKGDEKQLCTKTPIPLWEIDYRLLGGSQVPRLLPPMFHLGWPVGRDQLLELVQREFPELVLYTEADQKGEVLWDSIVYIPDGIIRDLNIPEELHECVQVSEVLHPDGTRQAALCVGDSRIGILRPNPSAIEQIAQRFFDGKDPQWYLDPWQWQWTRKGACSIIYGCNFELSTVRILSPEEARKWAADMNAREAALAGVAGIQILPRPRGNTLFTLYSDTLMSQKIEDRDFPFPPIHHFSPLPSLTSAPASPKSDPRPQLKRLYFLSCNQV
ncbi:hypothetical protein CCMSSC00406_0003563 [Pleurotus cornucopiae]|uniref:Uncharacterized protein n=1 Tax=Pleurotus cornucopiae TaxID=5321 RepID=A0ACB7IHK1_PLECO|nr:hypothetical protein CCMSSC00406_0003563 [Pleurotus cornucopiae]